MKYEDARSRIVFPAVVRLIDADSHANGSRQPVRNMTPVLQDTLLWPAKQLELRLSLMRFAPPIHRLSMTSC